MSALDDGTTGDGATVHTDVDAHRTVRGVDRHDFEVVTVEGDRAITEPCLPCGASTEHRPSSQVE